MRWMDISHMIMLPCFFSRFGDANKCTSSMDLPHGLYDPLGQLCKSLPFSSSPGMGTTRSKPPSCSVQAVTACPDVVPLPSHLRLLPALPGNKGKVCWSCLSWTFILKAGGEGLSFIKFFLSSALNSIKAKLPVCG